jgi:hypothetical protein
MMENVLEWNEQNLRYTENTPIKSPRHIIIDICYLELYIDILFV